MNQDEALDAARLAAMVGGQMKNVDKMFSERTAVPANKININAFADQVRNPNRKIKPATYLTNVPEGFAPPPPEEFVQQSIPEPVPSYTPPTLVGVPPPIPTQQVPPQTHQPSSLLKPVVTATQHPSVGLTRDDIDAIKKHLKSIDKSLAGMLNFLKNSKNPSNE